MISNRRVARNDEHIREPRQIGRQILGDAVGEILLLAVVAQITKGQHHDRQAWQSGEVGRNANAWRMRLPSAGRRGRGFDPCDWRDKAVAAPRNRLDAAALRSPIIEDAAQCCDLDVEVAVFDRRSRPNGLDDLVSRYEVARPLDQHAEKVERPPADCYRHENTLLIAPK